MQLNDHIKIKNLGPILEGTVKLGDITVLVGPQGSGKSLFLQWLKLIADAPATTHVLQTYGFEWNHDLSRFLTLYFGEGMGQLWSDNSTIMINDQPFPIIEQITKTEPKSDTLFLVPAQRIITLRTGWPLPLSDYGIDTSFAIKYFSESLRQLMSWEFGTGSDEIIFPLPDIFDQTLIELINASIFNNAKVILEKGLQKRIMLELENNQRLPFLIWSSGQREFVPLLLSLYRLLPSLKKKTDQIEWIVIEEPEMGLHPKAISAVLLLLIQLVAQGYKLIISTHSTQVLDMIWAITELKSNQAIPSLLLEIFTPNLINTLEETAQELVKHKQLQTYYFSLEKQGTRIKDISKLELDSNKQEISSWGGLTEFSSRVAQVVAKAARQNLVKSFQK